MTDVIEPVAKEFGYEAKRSIDDARTRDITIDMVASLLQADLVVADLTQANANAYYELAIRHAIQRPFVHVRQAGQLRAFNIQGLDTVDLPTRKAAKGIALPDPKKCTELLRPYFSAVVNGRASYDSILSNVEIRRELWAALTKIGRLPDHIQKSIFRYATSVPLYYTEFTYEIELFHRKHTVTYDMKVTFELMNVSDDPQTGFSRYPTTRKFKVKSAMIGGAPVDLQDPAHLRSDAFVLRYVIPPGKSARCEVSMAKTFSENENDLFTAYSYPCEKFHFRATNRSPGSLAAWVELLNTQSALANRDGNVLEWRATDPILPNQGVRLLWRPK